jgi:hypothetical protein
MVAGDIESSSTPLEPLALDNIGDLPVSVGKIVLQTEDDEDTSSKSSDAPRPLYIYTRTQALYISKSPLVRCPQGMPDFKDWFGWVSSQICRSFVLSITVSFKAIGTNNPRQRKIQMLPRHFQMAETGGMFACLTSASLVYQALASVVSGGTQTTLVHPFFSNIL